MSFPFLIIYIFKVQVSVKLTKHTEGQDITVLWEAEYMLLPQHIV